MSGGDERRSPVFFNQVPRASSQTDIASLPLNFPTVLNSKRSNDPTMNWIQGEDFNYPSFVNNQMPVGAPNFREDEDFGRPGSPNGSQISAFSRLTKPITISGGKTGGGGLHRMDTLAGRTVASYESEPIGFGGMNFGGRRGMGYRPVNSRLMDDDRRYMGLNRMDSGGDGQILAELFAGGGELRLGLGYCFSFPTILPCPPRFLIKTKCLKPSSRPASPSTQPTQRATRPT